MLYKHRATAGDRSSGVRGGMALLSLFFCLSRSSAKVSCGSGKKGGWSSQNMGFPEDTILYLVRVHILDVFMSSVRRERVYIAWALSANTQKTPFCIKYSVFQTETGLK